MGTPEGNHSKSETLYSLVPGNHIQLVSSIGLEL
jgi:hypothetical protein